MRKFFANPDHSVGLLASANLAWASVGKFIADLQPLMHFLLWFGQFAVAMVSVYYIWRKARVLRIGPKRRKRKRTR